jgi:hypothetical protein
MLLHKRNCDLATGADLGADDLSPGSTWFVRASGVWVDDGIVRRVQLPCAALPQERTTSCHLTGTECPAQPAERSVCVFCICSAKPRDSAP